MPKSLGFVAAPLAFILGLSVIGCTVFPEQKSPSLKNTTSAEQYERLLWQTVQKQQWKNISGLFSTTLVWHVDGKSLGSDQVVTYLQSLNLKDAVVRDASVRPNGPDMTVTYTLQISGPNGAPQDFSAFSVWQQMKGGSYILIAHSQQAQAGAPN